MGLGEGEDSQSCCAGERLDGGGVHIGSWWDRLEEAIGGLRELGKAMQSETKEKGVGDQIQ